MAHIQFQDKLEVDITIRLLGFRDRGEPWENTQEKPKEIKQEVLEEKKFNSLTLGEAIRKLSELVQ